MVMTIFCPLCGMRHELKLENNNTSQFFGEYYKKKVCDCETILDVNNRSMINQENIVIITMR